MEASKLHAQAIGIGKSTWNQSLRHIGADLPVALCVLDCNHSHPTTSVINVGGTLTGMARRAQRGELHLELSINALVRPVRIPTLRTVLD